MSTSLCRRCFDEENVTWSYCFTLFCILLLDHIHDLITFSCVIAVEPVSIWMWTEYHAVNCPYDSDFLSVSVSSRVSWQHATYIQGFIGSTCGFVIENFTFSLRTCAQNPDWVGNRNYSLTMYADILSSLFARLSYYLEMYRDCNVSNQRSA